MISKRVMTKRRNRLVLLAIPLGVFLWSIGWSFYWIGQKNERSRAATANKKENVTFTVLLPNPELKT